MRKRKATQQRLRNWALQALVTLVGVALSLLVAGSIRSLELYAFAGLALIFVTTQLLFKAFSLDSPFAVTSSDTLRVLLSAVVATLIAAGAASALKYPGLLSAIFLAGLSIPILILALRFGLVSRARKLQSHRPGALPIIVIGSGDAAASLVRLIFEKDHFDYSVVGCVDDQPLALDVAGARVLGAIDDLRSLIEAHLVGAVVIAIPSASAQLVRRIMQCCDGAIGHAGKPPVVRILPGVGELLNNGVKISRIRSVQPEDLLPRDPVRVDLAEIVQHVENRVILVTGAGGSIGSELCRQIVSLNPSMLLLLGHGENSLFAIDEELRLQFGFNRTKIILADVADAARIRNVFSEYRPHVVFHAAAHKHVPIVESNVCESVRNNILGTHVVALAAAASGAAKFVLLSTDKAVNPTSVMGATKRLSEIISQSFVNQTGTEFVTVRFGNVLESRGSVIPIFKKQIENGGPVTITHRDMQRYFMTIPEAVSLVLQAMAIGRDGQVLVLDMGKPVNILSLAETLITLSGLTPYRDINIVETGIRPGEKLFEEILTSHEGLSTTSHARLFIAQQERVAYETLALGLKALEISIKTGDTSTIIGVLRNFVPSFQPGSHLDAAMPAVDVADRKGIELTHTNGHLLPPGNGHVEEKSEALEAIPEPTRRGRTAGAIGN